MSSTVTETNGVFLLRNIVTESPTAKIKLTKIRAVRDKNTSVHKNVTIWLQCTCTRLIPPNCDNETKWQTKILLKDWRKLTTMSYSGFIE